MKNKLYWNILLTFYLGMQLSCSHKPLKPQPNTVSLSEGVELTLNEPREILPETQLVHHLTFERYDSKRPEDSTPPPLLESHSVDAILVSKDNKLSMVGVLPLGGELFRLIYDAKGLSIHALPMGLTERDLKYALADIIVIYASLNHLKKSLTSQIQIVETPWGKGFQRMIKKDGQNLIKVSYSSWNSLEATIQYEHLIRNYRIQILPSN